MSQKHWRIAIMLDARAGDVTSLEAAMIDARERFGAAARQTPLRLGVLDRDPDLSFGMDDPMFATWRGVDGAVELTVADPAELPAICGKLEPILSELAEPGTLEVMAGPIFPMVPVRAGSTFLSMAFRRFPDTTCKRRLMAALR